VSDLPETVDTAREIVKIKREIQDIKQSQEADMHFNRAKYEDLVNRVLSGKGNAISVEIFLEVDGLKSRKEIQEVIMSKGRGSQPTIWRAFDKLEASGLITKLEEEKNSSPVYVKPRWVKILRIDDYVRGKYLQPIESEERVQPGNSDPKPGA
jgi:hypothetical protein